MKTCKEGLTKEYLASLEAFSMDIQRKMQSHSYSGARKSNAKGSSMEFSDFREYIHGDDLRRVDWNSYARFDRLFLKLFMEEKQASIHVFLDVSASMAEIEEKAFYSKMLAASLAYITLKNTDRFHLFACGEQIHARKTKVQSKNSFLNVVQFLDQLEYQSGTKLTQAIRQATKEGLASGISIVLSDFFSEDGYQEAVKLLQYQKQTVILVQILAAEEEHPDFTGAIRLLDCESGAHLDLELTEAMILEYQKALKAYQNEMKEYCYQRGAKFVKLNIKMPILKGIYEII